jgi:2-polyprenyl-3-methyl-5-hydroxy-6-metoxy-1,4-benzoquinol methylase
MATVAAKNVGACPMCRGAGVHYATARDIEYFTLDRDFDFLQCTSCDVIYIDPMLKNDMSTIYPANYYSFDRSGQKNTVTALKEWLDRRAFQAFLKAIPGKQLALLDVGGGQGWLATLMQKTDARIVRTQVVDIDPAAKELAERQGHAYFCGRFEEFETPDKFDVILMLNLIEHVADPVGVLQKAQSLLSPDGRIYIKTPNFRALDAKIFRHRSWGGYHCPRHFVIFSRDSIYRAMTASGLRVTQFAFTQGAPFWSVSVLEQLRRWGLVTVSSERPAIYHPMMPLLQAAGAAFDFLRQPLAQLSQMIIIAGRNDTPKE